MKRYYAALTSKHTETVNIRIAESTPVDELDAQLECALGLTDEIILVKLQGSIELPDGRYCGFANTDRADFVGFDQANVVIADQHLGHGRCRHPAGSASADDHDVLYGSMSH